MSVTEEINDVVELAGHIAEMGPYETSTRPDLVVPGDFLAKIKATDDDPLFVTVTVEAGWSESKRLWKTEHLRKVVNKVNKDRMAGNLGHPLLDPKAYEREFPKPQVVWAAATLENDTATFKGYVLKSAEAREYLKMGLIDGVSIFGDSTMKPVKGGYEVVGFEPETIDFARKGRSGMKSKVVALTGEQAPGRTGGDAVDPKEIAALSPEEIKTHAPLVFRAIQEEATVPLTEKIGEMTTAADAVKPEIDLLGKIKELLKLSDGEDPVTKLGNLIERIEEAGSSEIKAYIKELIAKKVKTTRGQALVGRLIGEMHTEYDGPLTEDLKKKIETDFEAKVEGDEVVKELVGEMSTTRGNGGGEGEGGSSLGGRSRAGAQRGRENNGGTDGVVRQTQRLTVRSAKL